MWTRAVFAGLLSAAIAWPSATASTAECNDFELRFKGLPGARVTCETGGIGGGGDRGSGMSETIQVFGSRFVFVASHASVGHRTYLVRLTVKELLGNSPAFSSIDEWGEEAKNGEFAVRRFKGKFFDGARTACFGFARYSGHVPRTTGYRHLINGFYCDMDEVPPSDSRIGEVLSSLEYKF
jgi:hypothetical protein